MSRFWAIASVSLCALLLGGTNGDFNPKPSDAFERGYYVPAGIEEAVAQLQSALSADAKSDLRDTQQDRIASHYHVPLGSWIRRHWLYPGSRLREHFASEGVQSRDEASAVILKATWRELNHRPIEVHALLTASRNAEQANQSPEDMNCPDHPSEQMEALFKLVNTDPVEVVHVARCPSTDDLWIFEVKKGWSRPDPGLLEEISERMIAE